MFARVFKDYFYLEMEARSMDERYRFHLSTCFPYQLRDRAKGQRRVSTIYHHDTVLSRYQPKSKYIKYVTLIVHMNYQSGTMYTTI
jgi:hypothetical protein